MSISLDDTLPKEKEKRKKAAFRSKLNKKSPNNYF